MLGDKIYYLRKNKNISQEQFAEILNTSRQAVSKWERNESKPDIDKLISIAKLFNVSIDYLLNYEIKNTPVDYFINEIECCTKSNNLKVSIEDIKLWCSKYTNNFKLHVCSSEYLYYLYLDTKKSECLDFSLAYVIKAISLYSKEESETISLNDLHKLVTSIYELQQKYDLAKDYTKKNKVYGNDILLAKCELIAENYDTALELASEIYIGSISNIINTSFIQVEALLKTNKVKEAYDLVNWSISIINSINNNEKFFDSILYLFVYLKALCEKLLNISYTETVKLLRKENIEEINPVIISKTESIKHYFGKKEPLLTVNLDVKETIKELANKLAKDDKNYKILISLYKEVIGGDIDE